MSRRPLLLPLSVALVLAAAMIVFLAFPARNLPENRVEVLLYGPDSPASQVQEVIEAALQEDSGGPAGLSLRQEGDRWTVEGAGLFTARRLESALSGAGLPEDGYEVLDYSWARDTAATAAQLWQTAAAFCLLVLLGHLAAGLLRRERQRMAACLKTMYPAEVLQQNGERLVKVLILLVPLVLAAALLLRWLWGVQYCLPAGFLPEGSLFDTAHYSRWLAAAFPRDSLSPYAAQLEETLSLAYLGAGVISLLWVVMTLCLLPIRAEKR